MLLIKKPVFFRNDPLKKTKNKQWEKKIKSEKEKKAKIIRIIIIINNDILVY